MSPAPPDSTSVASAAGGSDVAVLTVLEAEVAPDRVDDLLASFRAAAGEPRAEFILRSSLVRSRSNPQLFRVMTVFRSMEELAAMRDSGETPRGVVMFRSAGAEPTLTIFEIVDELA